MAGGCICGGEDLLRNPGMLLAMARELLDAWLEDELRGKHPEKFLRMLAADDGGGAARVALAILCGLVARVAGKEALEKIRGILSGGASPPQSAGE